MAEQSFPFENIDTTESQFSEWATNFQETGVQGSPTGTELGITVTGSDLNLTVASGQAFIRGHYYINTDDLVLAVTSAGTDTRIDIVVVELDPEANTIVTKIVSGEAVSADPVAPTLTQSATGIYQLPIATLTIPTSTVVITAGMLVDTRTFMGNRVGIWTTATRPANPTDYQTLGYNTTIESHESWNGTGWVGFFDPISTAGDLVVGDGTGQASRLGVGTDDQVLKVVGGVPEWADGSAGGFYYNITAAGTYTVNLDAGLYTLASSGPVIVGGVNANGNVSLVNYPAGIDSLVPPGIGTTWVADRNVFSDNKHDIIYNNGLYVAVGDGGSIATSTNATSWTNRTSGFGTGYQTSTINGVAFGEGLYVAVGEAGKLATSPDAITWTLRTSAFNDNEINSVTYGNGLFVAGGEAGYLTTSTDGISWTKHYAGFGSQFNIYSVIYGDGLYVAVGDDGKITTSTDGSSWSIRTSGITQDLMSVGYGDGLYLSGDRSGDLITSPDAITWTSRTSGFDHNDDILGFAYGDGLYVAVGAGGQITTSTDGASWVRRVDSTGNIGGVAYGDALFVAVSDDVFSSEFTEVTVSLEPKAPIITLP
jgi:hypothetical protein